MWIVKPSLILSPAFCLYIGPSLLLLSHSITCLPHLSTHLSVDTHLFCLPALPCTLNHISELVISTHLHNYNLLYFSCPCTYIQLPAFRLELDFLDQNMSHLLTSQPLCETKKKTRIHIITLFPRLHDNVLICLSYSKRFLSFVPQFQAQPPGLFIYWHCWLVKCDEYRKERATHDVLNLDLLSRYLGDLQTQPVCLVSWKV